MSSCCKPQARLPDRSPRDGTRALLGAVGMLLLRQCWGGDASPAGPPGAPQAAWAVPHAECLRREAQSSQQRAHKAERQPPAAKYHVLMLCMPHQTPCSKGSLFPLPCPATPAGRLLPGPVGPTPHQDPEPSSGGGEGSLSHCVVGREVPGCTGSPCDPPNFEAR